MLPDTTDFLAKREHLVHRDVVPTPESRFELVELTDSWLRTVAESARLSERRVTLAAVGGYGRRELCACSDLDLVILHHQDESLSDVGTIADAIFYEIWDAGIQLDHSVRTVAQARSLAAEDLKVALGLMDLRCIAGNPDFANQLHSSVLGDWRAMAQPRLHALRTMTNARRERFGDITHLLEPDLKETFGGLRDVTTLRGIAATWMTDIDHTSVNAASLHLLNVRDALHRVTNSGTDRLTMQEQSDVAQLLGIESDDELLRSVYVAGRAISAASNLAWHRLEKVIEKKSLLKKIGSTQTRSSLAQGVVVQENEVVLARGTEPSEDPVLALRAAAAAAQAGLPLSPFTIQRLCAESAAMPVPWPQDARDALVALLGAGKSAIGVWESLDIAGYFHTLFPEWSAIRATPQRNALHIYTIDRHSLECAAQAASLARNVLRPDLLLVAALFHDIGKARGGDHCVEGATLMQEIAVRLGFDESDQDVLVRLVRDHLLLAECATSRDLDDPATIETVTQAVQTHEVLNLLHALTIADSKSAGPGVWSDWKSRLLAELVARADATLAGDQLPISANVSDRFPVSVDDTQVVFDAGSHDLLVATPDRIGLVAAVAGALSLLRLEVRSADLDTKDGVAYQVWHVATQFGDLPDDALIVQEISRAIIDGGSVRERVVQLQPMLRPRRGFVAPPPQVSIAEGASERATVLDVRAHDAPALLHKVAHVLAGMDVSICAARVVTLGAEVVDALYLQNQQGGLLSQEQSEEVVRAVLAAVSEPEE